MSSPYTTFLSSKSGQGALISSTPAVCLPVCKRSNSRISDALTGLILIFQNDHGRPILAFVRKAEMKPRDPFLTTDFQGPAIESQTWPAAGKVEDFDVPPTDTFSHPQTDCL